MWRSWDRPIVGTSLVRGITFTILPDGQSMRVPAMNRAEVRAHSNKHAEGEQNEIMQALHDLMHGKNPQAGRGARDIHGVHKVSRVNQRGQGAVHAPNVRAPNQARNGMPQPVLQGN